MCLRAGERIAIRMGTERAGEPLVEREELKKRIEEEFGPTMGMRAKVMREVWKRAMLQAIHRGDRNAFIEYVMRDERTGQRVRQGAVQEMFQNAGDAYERLVFFGFVESGKTLGLVARILQDLGEESNLRIAYWCNTAIQAGKVGGLVRTYLENSEDLKEVYPDLRLASKAGGQLTVSRTTPAKDPSLQIFGVHGNVLGSRIDRLYIDDVVDYENAKSPTQREDLWNWFWNTLYGRLNPEDSRIVAIGNPYHPEDLLHRLCKSNGWWGLRVPVRGQCARWDHSTGRWVMFGKDGLQWPERWPAHFIDKREAELGPVEFSRQMLCIPRDDSTARFKREWIETGIRLGNGRDLAPFGLATVPPGYRIYTGVDLAVQQHSAADLTVFFTIAVHPDGTREVLNIESGRWNGPDIVQRMRHTQNRFQSVVIVENVAAQDYIRQFALKGHTMPVWGFTTGRGKASLDFHAEKLSAELASGKWIIPNDAGVLHPDVSAWVSDMLYFDPASHTGDRLAACLFARSGAEKGTVKGEVGYLALLNR